MFALPSNFADMTSILLHEARSVLFDNWGKSVILCGDEVKAAEKGPLLRPPPHWSTSHQTRVDVKLIVVVTLMFSPSLFSLLSTLMLPAAFASAHCPKSPFLGPKIQFR